MLNNEQYNFVKDILVDRMSRYRRNTFQLQRLYEILLEKLESETYISFSYEEFRNMFMKEIIQGNIPNHKFSILEEGYLDKKQKYPYANIGVEVFSKKKKYI